jgi:hypothetical protein
MFNKNSLEGQGRRALLGLITSGMKILLRRYVTSTIQIATSSNKRDQDSRILMQSIFRTIITSVLSIRTIINMWIKPSNILNGTEINSN